MKKIYLKFYLFILLSVINLSAFAQKDVLNIEGNRLSPKEFTISASPVFDLMGVTPSQVNRTSDIKDFKVDWLFKSWRLNPNFGIQSQPVWEILYNRKDLKKYQQASFFMRRLASLDFSIGSIQNEENDRRIGFSTKLNLFKSKDPLLVKDLYSDLGEKYKTEEKELEAELKVLDIKLDTIQNIIDKAELKNRVELTKELLLSINSRQREEINSRTRMFVAENWNASSVDIAFGRINTYQTDSAGSLKSLRMNRNTAWGAWLNGNVGFGRNFLLSGLLRSSWYEEQVTFVVKNIASQEERPHTAVAGNRLFTMGINIRYGGPIYTFFAEILHEQKALNTPVEVINDAFKTPDGNFIIVPSSAKWNVVQPNTISIGGDWRMSRNLILNYGMRGVFNEQWKFTAFVPVATISCMMR